MIHRTIEKRIKSLTEDFKILFATGARQVGKTTLLKAMKEEERSYVNLDDTASLDMAKNDPTSFFLLHPVPCYIDEVQRADELFIPMKKIVDENNQNNQIWITGSQKPKLKKKVGDTLSGRAAEIEIYPLSQAEKQGCYDREEFFPLFTKEETALWTYQETLENIILGGYPALQTIKEENRSTWFRSYINTYLLGDIRQ